MSKDKLKKISLIIIFMFFIMPLTALGEEVQSSSSKNETNLVEVNQVKHVFLVVIPGLTESEIKNKPLPILKSLAGEGVWVKTSITDERLEANKEIEILLGGKGNESYDKLLSANRLEDSFKVEKNNTIIYDGFKNKDTSIIDSALVKFKKEKPYLNIIITPPVNQGQGLVDIDKKIGKLLSVLHEYGVYDYSSIAVIGSKGNYLSSNLNMKNMPTAIFKSPNSLQGKKITTIMQKDIFPTVIYLSQKRELQQPEGNIIWDAVKTKQGSYVNEQLYQRRINQLNQDLYNLAADKYSLVKEQKEFRQEKERIHQEKMSAQKIVKEKDKVLAGQTTRIRIYEGAALVFLLVAGMGYIAEYFYLRKRFMMF